MGTSGAPSSDEKPQPVPEETPAGQSPQLYADIVFDRPLDTAYAYSVPERLGGEIGVGKRVEAPFGRGDTLTTGYCVRLHHTPPSRPAKAIARVLDAEAIITDSLLQLTRWMADYYLCGWGQVLNAVVPAGARDATRGRELVMVEAIPEANLGAVREDLSEKQAGALHHLRRANVAMEQRQLLRATQCGAAAVSALVKKGYARTFRQRVDPQAPCAEPVASSAPPITLNGDQLLVMSQIERAVRQGGFHAFLLHGVTGSGKTEIYLKAIEEIVRQGKEAIVLVPEISLTPQTTERFRGRCGEIAVLHSHLRDRDRGSQWRRVASGQVQVIVGARSAIFAPTRRLGLVVVDEEHEGSFKQESTPRYHGRDLAVMRARMENVPVILGSATPSLESWHNARRGQYTLLSLPNRVLDRPLPLVGLIDLRHDGPKNRQQALSPRLEQAIRRALDGGGQVMLLLNRRGFSTHVHCPSCGHVVTCRHCDLTMTYHRQRTSLVCHYCGFEAPPIEHCPNCKQMAIRYQGLGTEKLQAEIEGKFPNKVVQRMDSDTMQRPGTHQRVLDAFRDGSVHVLLGTQMIAKGLDFPNVTLVGVVNADVGLNVPDFRAAERTFQLLAQVAGRTGRGPRGGQVLVQTFTPENPCIALAATHDYQAFAKRELDFRAQHQYPPYQRLARLIIRSERQSAVEAFAGQMAAAFQQALAALTREQPTAPAVRVLGPAEAPVFRLMNYYRYHFQVQSPSAAILHQVLRRVLATVRAPHGIEYVVDVDPHNMM